MTKEMILCAAIHYDDGSTQMNNVGGIDKGGVLVGQTHSGIKSIHCLLTGKNTREDNTQGFLTNTNRFVDRTEALTIALNANQVKDISNIRGGKLYSEDLY